MYKHFINAIKLQGAMVDKELGLLSLYDQEYMISEIV